MRRGFLISGQPILARRLCQYRCQLAKELVGVIKLQHRRPRRYRLREVKLLSTVEFLLGADIGISRLESQNFDLLMELETRKLVARGTGILQRELGVSEHEASLALQLHSQQKERPMKEIAQAIILSAEVRQEHRQKLNNKRRGGQVARQGSAKPSSAVRFRPAPPNY
jgi:signal transduction protein with GAF and PtsI domain